MDNVCGTNNAGRKCVLTVYNQCQLTLIALSLSFKTSLGWLLAIRLQN